MKTTTKSRIIKSLDEVQNLLEKCGGPGGTPGPCPSGKTKPEGGSGVGGGGGVPKKWESPEGKNLSWGYHADRKMLTRASAKTQLEKNGVTGSQSYRGTNKNSLMFPGSAHEGIVKTLISKGFKHSFTDYEEYSGKSDGLDHSSGLRVTLVSGGRGSEGKTWVNVSKPKV